MKLVKAFALIILLFTNHAVASDIDDAFIFMKEEKYAEVLEIVQPLALQGDAEATFLLSMLYMGGLEIPEDFDKGVELLTFAADKENLQAQILLASMLNAGGQGAKALPYAKKAAATGDPEGQYVLGLSYLSPDMLNTENSVENAYEWLNKAADQGNIPALSLLATTEISIKNYNKAFSYYGRAGQLGDGESAHKAALLLIEHDLRIENFADNSNQNLAFQFLRKAASLDYVPSIKFLAEYEIDSGNLEAALHYYMDASKLNDPDSSYKVAWLLREHDFPVEKVIQDAAGDVKIDLSYIYFEKAAEAGHLKAQILLAREAEAAGNIELAMNWLALAAKQDDLPSIKKLISLYDIDKDLGPKIGFIVQADKLGDLDSTYQLAKLFQDGVISIDGEDHPHEKLYLKAAKAGHKESRLELGKFYVKEKQIVPAAYWLEKRAISGGNEALDILIKLLRDSEQYNKLADWLVIAYFRGNTEASHKIYELVKNKFAYAGNLKKQQILLKYSSDNGNLNAIYYSGLFAEKAGERVNALKLFDEASKLGHYFSKTRLAQQFLKQDPLTYEYKSEAYRLFRDAAEAGVAQAMFNFAALSYEFGDKVSAYTFAFLAAEAGIDSADEVFEFVATEITENEKKDGKKRIEKWNENGVYLNHP